MARRSGRARDAVLPQVRGDVEHMEGERAREDEQRCQADDGKRGRRDR
jgi:hypothetical protein